MKRDTNQDEVRTCLNLLTPRKVIDYKKIRVGTEADGGYVMLDDLGYEEGSAAYSIGVGPDTTWDVSMAERGWIVHQYDHTVESAPHSHPRCNFNKIGLANNDESRDLKRLDTLLTYNGNNLSRKNILKIDIEGNEYECLESLPLGFFDTFSQIVAEFHWLDHLHSPEFRKKFRNVVGNLSITHHCIHVHANNYGDFIVVHGVPVPQVIEFTMVKKSMYGFTENFENSPSSLDRPNTHAKSDLFLGLFKF